MSVIDVYRWILTDKVAMFDLITENNPIFSYSMKYFPGLLTVKNSDLRYVFVNENFVKFSGFTQPEILGKKEYELFGVQYCNKNKVEKNILESGEIYKETHKVSYNNQTSYYRVFKYRISTEKENYLVVLSVNIDDEIQKETELRKNETYLRTIVDYSDSVMAVLDDKGSIRNFLKSDRIINKPSTAFRILISEIIDTHSSKLIIENVKHVLKTKKELTLKKSLTYKNQQFFLKDNYYPIVNEDGSVTEVGIIRQDISKNREIEEAYTNLVNNSSVGLFIIQDGSIVFVNNSFSQILGFSIQEIESYKVTQFIKIIVPINARNSVLREYDNIANNNVQNKSYTMRLYTKSGSLIWVELTWNRIIYNGSTAIQASISDITEKRLALNNLEKFKHIVNASHEGIIFIDTRKKITLVNNRIQDMLHLSYEKIIGHTMELFLGETISNSILRNLYDECFVKGKFIKTEEWVNLPDGERFLEISINPYFHSNDKITGAIVVINDVTEEIETDLRMNEIKQNERRKIAMELHDGLTHELLGISINTKILDKKIEEKGNCVEMRDMLKSINSDLNSAIAIAKNLSRGISPIHEQYTNLKTMLDDLQSIVERRYNIQCNISFIQSVEIRKDNVLENLYYIIEESVTNAVKHARAKRVDIEISKENDFAIIRIKDFGNGPKVSLDQTQGLGLKFIKMRCRAISASFDFQSDNSGTVVSCKLKL